AVFDTRQMPTDRIGAVQFVRFPVGSSDRGQFLALAEAGRLSIEVDHPSLAARAPIVGNLARALAEDLGGLTPRRNKTPVRGQNPVDQFMVTESRTRPTWSCQSRSQRSSPLRWPYSQVSLPR